MEDKTIVSKWKEDGFESYPSIAPYNPSVDYPEYNGDISEEKNCVYSAFRNALHQMKLDEENYGKETWNPLGYLISPGNLVVIKPNFVLDRNEGDGTIDSVVTNSSLIRAVIDYVYIALDGKGLIVVGDASQANCDYEKLLKNNCIYSVVEYYKEKHDFTIEVDDFRQMRYEYHNGFLDDTSREFIVGDPRGYTIFDLRDRSFLKDLPNPERIYGADYDREEVRLHHQNGKNEYCIASTIVEADVVISMPKLKTHKKSGVTINLKNLVGINGNKNYLPHYRIGTPSQGGDEYESLGGLETQRKNANRMLTDKLLAKPSRLKSTIYKFLLKTYLLLRKISIKKKKNPPKIGGGSWYGNDTIWRMILDLNLILLYGDKDGNIGTKKSRKTLCVVDGMICGEAEGPMAPTDRKEGIILVGENPLAVDVECIKAMGFNYKAIPLYREAERRGVFGIRNVDEEISVLSNTTCRNDNPFVEPSGWQGIMRI